MNCFAESYFIAVSISFTAFARPMVRLRLMMLWPMFSSTRCGTTASSGGTFAQFKQWPALTCKPSSCACAAAAVRRFNSALRSRA